MLRLSVHTAPACPLGLVENFVPPQIIDTDDVEIDALTEQMLGFRIPFDPRFAGIGPALGIEMPALSARDGVRRELFDRLVALGVAADARLVFIARAA